MDTNTLKKSISDLMPQAKADLARLVAYKSVADPDIAPLQECLDAANDVVQMFMDVGVENVQLVDMPYGHPAVYGHTPAPSGAPTVLLYGHYDVQPPMNETGEWSSDPFELTEIDGRWYGRGAADCKGNVIAHITALKAFKGKFPVGIKVIIEGSEEQGLGELEGYVEQNPEKFQADAILVADTGNFKLGLPTFTTTLRGMCTVEINLKTLEGPVHSGEFGGPAPDALTALIQMLNTLHDKNGNVTINNLDNSQTWKGVEYPDDQFRKDARVLDGVDLVGDGGVASLLWSRVALSVIGLDCPRVVGASNVVQSEVKALLSMRIPPGLDTKVAQDALVAHLESVVPWHAQVKFTRGDPGQSFEAHTSGPAYTAMSEAMATAYGQKSTTIGQGGSIPLANTLQDACPQAELMLVGVEEPLCLIHAPNESVDPKELEHHTLSEALFFEKFAKNWKK